MTICLGWQDDDSVYLAADSAVTRRDTRPRQRPESKFSSFGELQHYTEEIWVEEAALKIFRHGNAAAACSGEPHRAEAVFDTFIAFSAARSVRGAFESAWASWHGPGTRVTTQMLFGFYDETGPHLLQFDSADQTEGKEVKTACIGNVRSEDSDFFSAAMTAIPPHAESGPDKLACLVGLIQPLGVHSNLMRTHGVGGYVAGCWIGKGGLIWAPDMLHVLIRNGLADQLSNDVLNTIVTCERVDMFFVLNNFTNAFIGFTNKFGINTGRSTTEVVENVLRRTDLLPRIWSGQFKVDYIMFHDLSSTVTTVACVRNDRPRLVGYGVDRGSNSMAIRFHVTGPAARLLMRSPADGLFAFIA